MSVQNNHFIHLYQVSPPGTRLSGNCSIYCPIDKALPQPSSPNTIRFNIICHHAMPTVPLVHIYSTPVSAIPLYCHITSNHNIPSDYQHSIGAPPTYQLKIYWDLETPSHLTIPSKQSIKFNLAQPWKKHAPSLNVAIAVQPQTCQLKTTLFYDYYALLAMIYYHLSTGPPHPSQHYSSFITTP